jgi:predicted phage baseplate assembly protein
MPLTVPRIDDRAYADLLREALARIPVHTPEWTNFNESDPGVTLVDMFAFLTESLIYRANLIPERNRLKFLGLLGVALQPGESARGFVTISNERGALQTVTLNGDLEVRAGPVPFRTELGLDVLPIETQLFYKRVVPNAPPDVLAYYRELYLSYLGGQSLDTTAPLLYETTPFPPPAAGGSAAGGGGTAPWTCVPAGPAATGSGAGGGAGVGAAGAGGWAAGAAGSAGGASAAAAAAISGVTASTKPVGSQRRYSPQEQKSWSGGFCFPQLWQVLILVRLRASSSLPSHAVGTSCVPACTARCNGRRPPGPLPRSACRSTR